MIDASKDSSDIKSLVAIAAGKGGVGKSTIASMLAVAFNLEGEKVGLLDADLYGPSQRHLFLQKSSVQAVGGRIIPALSSGIKVLSIADFRTDKVHDTSIAFRAPIANMMIKQLLFQVDWGKLDTLIVDMPPGTGDIHLTLLHEVKFQGALLVTTPQEVALLDVRKTATLFQQLHVPILGVIENMSYFKDSLGNLHFPFGQGGGEKLAEEIKVPFLGKIPIDPVISSSMDERRSPFERSKLSEGVLIFMEIVEKIRGTLCVQ